MSFFIIVQLYARKIGRQQSACCCWRDLCSWPAVWSQYSIGLEPTSFYDILRCQWSMLTRNVVYWSVLHFILDSAWVWYSLLRALKIPTLVWHWGFVLCLRHWEVYSLQVMRTQLETLGEEFKLAVNIWWRESIILWILDNKMYWHCEDNDHIDTSYLSEEFVWWDVSVLWGQYLHHRHRDLRIAQHKIPFYRSLRQLWLSLWGWHCFETTLIIARGRTTRLWFTL